MQHLLDLYNGQILRTLDKGLLKVHGMKMGIGIQVSSAFRRLTEIYKCLRVLLVS